MLIAITLLMTTLTTKAQQQGIEFGIFSTNPNDYQIDKMKIQHYFTTWNDKELDQTRNQINMLNLSGKQALLTVEPWPEYGEWNSRELFLTNIVEGRYTNHIARLCTYIQSNFNRNIILRWGHEMELTDVSIYPWVSKDNNLFIQAYKKWVDTCKQYTNKVSFMWSPSGNNGNEKYYPGDNYVDIIGFSWYSYPAYEWYSYNTILDFGTIMDWKYNKLKQYNRPIIAAEFGMAEQNKTNIKNELYNQQNIKNKYPLLQSIVFFSDRTQSWIPNVISAPDWTIDSQFLRGL